jgi:hypothetical protein
MIRITLISEYLCPLVIIPSTPQISVYQLLPGQPKMLTKITMADAHQHYWGFVLCDNMLAYVSNQTVIKVYGIEELLAASSPGGEAHHHLGQQPHEVLFRMDTGSRVLSFHTEMRADRLHVWAICADRGVRHFKQGQLMRTWPNVLGEIGALGYPLVCRVRGDYLFYAADDGVYYLNVFSDALTPE